MRWITGKSVVSKTLSIKYKIDCIHLDKLRKKIQRQYSRKNEVNLLINNRTYFENTDKKLLDIHQNVSNFVLTKIGGYLKKRIIEGGVIIEGDDLTPKFCSRFSKQKNIHIVCIYENNPMFVENRISKRDKGRKTPSKDIYRKQLRHAYLFGKSIHQLAISKKIKCLKSAPLSSLAERILKIINKHR